MATQAREGGPRWVGAHRAQGPGLSGAPTGAAREAEPRRARRTPTALQSACLPPAGGFAFACSHGGGGGPARARPGRRASAAAGAQLPNARPAALSPSEPQPGPSPNGHTARPVLATCSCASSHMKRAAVRFEAPCAPLWRCGAQGLVGGAPKERLVALQLVQAAARWPSFCAAFIRAKGHRRLLEWHAPARL